MEDSIMDSSMINQSFSSKTRMNDDNDSSEESGWTSYIEDFLDNKKQYSNSLVPDSSVSCVASKKCGTFEKTWSKQLRFKKRKSKGGLVVDDDLEDTASSPVNSPKVSQFNMFMEMKQKEKDNKKWSGSSYETDKTSGENEECTELKKIGLCLVPFSLFDNYLG